MFDFLKKKIGGFIDGLTGREAEKEAPPEEKEEPEVPKKKIEPEPSPKKEEKPKIEERKTAPEKKEKKPEPKAEKKPEAPPKKEVPKPVEVPKPEVRKIEPQKPAIAQPPKPSPPQVIEAPKPIPPPKIEAPRPQIEIPKTKPTAPAPIPKIEIPKPPQPEPVRAQPEIAKAPQPEIAKPAPRAEEKQRISLSPVSAIKSFITREVVIGEDDVKELLDNLELELLEADVEMSVSEGISAELREKLIGAKVKKDNLHAFITSTIRETLQDTLSNDKAFSIPERVDALQKPTKIMFIGVNGSGKTTTIAKVARLLMNDNKKVVFAAADTFRAAAIEQMGIHAERLGVKMIKRDYGSDPTSVAYDAVNYAKAHGMDAVLIDTAGRQDTNLSLLNEMKKMSRIIQPDMKIYVGEAIAGNAIIEQVASFNREIGIDAVILTKMDCDAKGGTMLSISKVTGVPIIYVGMGQGYDELEKFDPAKIAARIVE